MSIDRYDFEACVAWLGNTALGFSALEFLKRTIVDIFGTLPDGRDVHSVRLRNDDIEVRILTFGASVQNLSLNGAPMVIGSEDLNDYLGPMQYFGAIVGRVANRIAHARAQIGSQQISLNVNEASGNCLHGGQNGASAQIWKVAETGPRHVVFELTLPDGHMGFPGKLEVRARYELHDLTLGLEISAQSDATTLCCFAPHLYWNLSGEPNINDHSLKIAAQDYLPLDARSIPTGEVARVRGTDFDFTNMRKLAGTELDHNFCISNLRQDLRPVLWLKSAQSGVALEVASTETGVQVYDARHLDRTGLAIEPQVWPDAINQEGFPKLILEAGETYRAIIEFRLSKRAHS